MLAQAFVRVLAVASVSLLISACGASLAPRQPLSPALAATATIAADQTIRYWGDDPRFIATHSSVRAGSDGKVDYLTLSGGGINGAYGAGYLVGWTARGTRPEFEVVTGISVGAMIAPLAFLGPRYDDRLKSVLSTLTQQDNIRVDFISALFGAPSVMGNKIIQHAIDALIDERTLADIGQAHRAGRRLYVGTTNMDAQRPVVWDIGAIAVSNLPDKLELVHSIILASTAVPGVFPPILIDAQAQGQRINELHVDGGVTQQVLLMPGAYKAGAGKSNLYVIFNGVVEPQPATVTKLASLDLLQRAVPTLLKYLGRANLDQLDNIARANHIAFSLTAIPAEFPESSSLLGDKAWLLQLFDYGYSVGKAGAWQKSF